MTGTKRHVSFAMMVLGFLSVLLIQGCVHESTRPGLKEDPKKTAEIYVQLGLGYLRQGRLEIAQSKLEQAIKDDPDNADAHHYLAEVYKQLEEYDLADAAFRKAVRLSPNDPKLLNNYGAFLCQQSRFDEAEADFLKALKTPRYKAPELVYENIALCALKVDNKDKAEEYFRKALELRPDLPKSLYQMAELYHERGDDFRARAFLQRLHSLGQQSADSLKLGIAIETARGDKAAVAEYQDMLREKFPHAMEDEKLPGEGQ